MATNHARFKGGDIRREGSSMAKLLNSETDTFCEDRWPIKKCRQPTVGGLIKKYFLFIMRLWRTINKNTLSEFLVV